LARANIIIDLSNPESIIEALGKEGSVVQIDTINALGDTKNKDATKYLTGFLSNDSVILQITSAESLCKLGSTEGVATLVGVVVSAEASELFQLTSINAMKSCAENVAIDNALLEILSNESSRNIRLLAAMELQERAKISHLENLEVINRSEHYDTVRATNDKTIRDLQHKKKMQGYLETTQ
jgi:HEAT repeat protein